MREPSQRERERQDFEGDPVVESSNHGKEQAREETPHGTSYGHTLPLLRRWFGDKTLRHPNLCAANLLGEACPIFQKFRDFSPFLGGRLKPLRLHESWRKCRDALKI